MRNYIRNRLGISDGILVEIDYSGEYVDCTCDMKTLIENNSLIYHIKKKTNRAKKQSVNEHHTAVGDEEENAQDLEMEALNAKFETHLIGCLRKPKMLD